MCVREKITPKSNLLRILTLTAFFGLFVIAMMKIFNEDNYYYSKHWKAAHNLFNIGPRNASHPLVLIQTEDSEQSDEDTLSDYKYKEPNSDEIAAEFEQKLPNIPFGYKHRHANRKLRKSPNCANFPAMQTLRYYNTYWQTYDIKNITFQLYAAYYDDRADVPDGPVIRILAMINQLKGSFPKSYCQIWYDDEDKPDITAITEYKSIWIWGGRKMFFPHLLTCKPTQASPSMKGRIPKAVAIVEQQCDTPRNMLKVIYNKPLATAAKEPFAVCVKGLDFPYSDISSRLVEWLELHRLMGVKKVYMYEIAIHPNVKKVLTYYQMTGFVEVRPITLVGGVVALPHIEHWLIKVSLFNKRLNELVPYNDCFYRHMYKHDHIALVDIDEVIMPLGELKTWQDIVNASMPFQISKKCSNGFVSLCFRNTYYPYKWDNFTMDTAESEFVAAQPYTFLLNHPYRTSNYSRVGDAAKCLTQTSKAVALHNHYPVQYMNTCRWLNMPTSVAHMQHYHDFKPGKQYTGLVFDNTVDRYRVPLIEATTRVLQDLGLLE